MSKTTHVDTDYQIGELVNVEDDHGTTHMYEVKSPPWQLGNGRWVIGLKGITGGYDLARVRKIRTPGASAEEFDRLYSRVAELASERLGLIRAVEFAQAEANEVRRDRGRWRAYFAAAHADANRAYSRCIAIARGCLDYGGGYRSDPEKLAAYHHGIETVVRALVSAKVDPTDSQVAALERIGKASEDTGS